MGDVRLHGLLKYSVCVVTSLPTPLPTLLVDVAGMVGTTNARQFLYFLDAPEKPTRVSTAQHCGYQTHTYFLYLLAMHDINKVFHTPAVVYDSFVLI